MKKLISIISIFILTVLIFVGCGDEKLEFEYIKNMAVNSEMPYKIETSINYTLGELVLDCFSSLEIEKQDSLYKAKYCYSTQKLNEIQNNSSEKISTLSGTTYYNGTNIGYLIGNEIDWQTENGFEAFEFHHLNFDAECFDKISITQQSGYYIFQGEIKSSSAHLLFAMENLDINNITLTIFYDEDINEIIISYKNLDAGMTTINIKYNYTNQSITIPD